MKRKACLGKLHRRFQIRKLGAVMLGAVMAVAFCACGSDFQGYVDEEVKSSTVVSGEKKGGGGKIGVSMPTKELQRWVQDGQNMESHLRDSGYSVDLQYADNDAAAQDEQVAGMVEDGCKVLVIAAIDGTKLRKSLDAAKAAGAVVIAYDRLIMDSDAVGYYASFDNQLVGTLQGKYIAEALDLENTDGPYNIELFTGSPDDNNCNFFFGGAMEVLQPYIDAGKLVIPSGQSTKEACSTKEWSTDRARDRMSGILKKFYSDGKKLDAVLSSNDSVALGIADAISKKYKGDFPVLTGQDCDINSVKNIIGGKQSMSVFKDTRNLASKVVEMITAILKGEEVPVNDTTSYDNGTGPVPSFLCEPVFADQGNYKKVLIDSGYYTADQLK